MKSHARKNVWSILVFAALVPLVPGAGHRTPSGASPAAESLSKIQVEQSAQGPITLHTPTAEFEILPSGYVRAFLLAGGRKITLDDPGTSAQPGDYPVEAGKAVHFALDLAQARISETTGKLGTGKRVEVSGNGMGAAGTTLQRTLVFELYDDFPNLLLTSAEYKNIGKTDIQIEKTVDQRHRFNAQLAGEKSLPYEMWSFQGASYDWGKDEIVKLKRAFARPNVMGGTVKGGYGGGIPVVAFWTRSVGEAVGHIETVPLSVSLPVGVSDQRVSAELDSPATTLRPGESFSTPRSFLAVYSGDFYEPLRMWSSALQKEGWEITKPSGEAYNVSWCGWGYEADVTPAQMLGTIPKLKEMDIKWATLDDRWFDNYGDWRPRQDTFPGDSIQKLVKDFHEQGLRLQLWWLPLGVEDGQGKYESHKYLVSDVVRQHPEWLILDKRGQHARMTRGLAALCPAVPEVQQYYKQLTEKFIRDWNFDGSKLDNIYTVPACYNPAHHHKSPEESVRAVADVYKTIFQTTRALKPESVTQSCPCGTPPSLAWLPFMDQAVTADPVGAVQVRRRIKMYKALLGPEAAVYGDHVELSAMARTGAKKPNDWIEFGDDFASTVGTGGVVGTKFVWPELGTKFKRVNLSKEKEEHWKKWIAIYNQKMLSKGAFLDLYTYGYDTPEAYAIKKDDKMYYGFFAPDAGVTWTGQLELRGLAAGTYHVFDYGDGKDLGTIRVSDGTSGTLKAEFRQHLLLEVSRQQ